MESLVTWTTTHALALVVGIVVLILVYRYAGPFIHRLVVTVLRAQQATSIAAVHRPRSCESGRKRSRTC